MAGHATCRATPSKCIFPMTTASGKNFLESVNTLAPAHVDWENVALVNGKAVPQSTRMSGKRMNLKFGGQNLLQQLASSGGVEVTRKLGDAPEETTASRELLAKFDKTGEWSTIDQTGDVHFHDAAARGARGPSPCGSRHQYCHAGRLCDFFGCHDADHGAIGILRSRGRHIARRRPCADHGFASRRGRAFQISRKSPRTFRRSTSSRTQRKAMPCIRGKEDCGRGSP